MNIVPIIQTVAGLISSVSAGAVVGNAVKATTPADIKRVNKVLVTIGGFVLSGVAGDLASKYVEKEIGSLAESFKNARLAGAAKSEVAQAAKETFEAAKNLGAEVAQAAKSVVDDAVFLDDPKPADDKL